MSSLLYFKSFEAVAKYPCEHKKNPMGRKAGALRDTFATPYDVTDTDRR